MLMPLLAVLVSPAEAAGYYFSDLGPRAMGKGAAVIAGVDDLTAQYYNPAALLRAGTQAQVQLAGVDQYVQFDRADEDGLDPFAPVENQAKPYAIPTFGVSHNLGSDRFNLMLGFYAPYAPDLSFPADGAQRYTLVDTQLIQTAFGPSAAFAVNDWVTVGAGLSWNLLYIQQELAVTVDSDLDPTVNTDDPAYDVSYSVESMDKSAFSENVGVLVEPPGGDWAVGVSVQPPITFQGTGPMAADFSSHEFFTGSFQLIEPTNDAGDEALYRDDETTLTVQMPLIVRMGALVRPVDGLEIEAGVVWQGWSIVETVVVDDVEIALQTTISSDPSVIEGPIELPANYVDALSYRLGAAWDASDSLTLRLGGLYETSAVPAKTLGVSLVDGVKTGVGFGATWRAGDRLEVDVGMLETFMKPTEVTNSEVTAIRVHALTGEVSEDSKVVGNGSFTSRLDMAALALTWRFGSGAGG